MTDSKRRYTMHELLQEAFGHVQAGMAMGGDKRHIAQAFDISSKILASQPYMPEAMFVAATCLEASGNPGVALHLMEALSRIQPLSFEIHNNLACVYRKCNLVDKARSAIQAGLSVAPEGAKLDVYANLISTYVNEGCPEDGLNFFREAQKIPNWERNPHIGWNGALLCLESELWDEGFELYDRFCHKANNKVQRDYAGAPKWDGMPVDTLVVYGEQGVGDEILFAGYLRYLKEHGLCKRLILDCHPRLMSILRNSLGCIDEIFPTRKTTPEWARGRTDISASISIACMMRYLSRDVKRHGAYLKVPDGYDIPAFDYIPNYDPNKKNIGLGWIGGTQKTRIDLRSIDIELFKALFDQYNVFSFQYTADGYIDAERTGGKLIHLPYIHEFEYAWTAALASKMHHVLCINTSLAHLSGAMGIPCITLTPHGHAWRYGYKAKGMTPFYSSVQKITQENGCSWKPAVDQAINAILTGV